MSAVPHLGRLAKAALALRSVDYRPELSGRAGTGQAMTAWLPRRLITATCRRHGGGIGFTNLVLTWDPVANLLVMDPHVDQSCVLSLDRTSASLVHHQTLGQWLALPEPDPGR